jgi:hypothetical protein
MTVEKIIFILTHAKIVWVSYELFEEFEELFDKLYDETV